MSRLARAAARVAAPAPQWIPVMKFPSALGAGPVGVDGVGCGGVDWGVRAVGEGGGEPAAPGRIGTKGSLMGGESGAASVVERMGWAVLASEGHQDTERPKKNAGEGSHSAEAPPKAHRPEGPAAAHRS